VKGKRTEGETQGFSHYRGIIKTDCSQWKKGEGEHIAEGYSENISSLSQQQRERGTVSTSDREEEEKT